MTAELDSTETELIASSWYFAQLGNEITNMVFHGKPLIMPDFFAQLSGMLGSCPNIPNVSGSRAVFAGRKSSIEAYYMWI